jgi:hypothetical protein
MDIIGAAALIAVGIVLAAVLYARAHPVRSRIPLGAGAHPQAGALGLRGRPLRDVERRRGSEAAYSDRAAIQDGELSERAEALARREASLSQREQAVAEREA